MVCFLDFALGAGSCWCSVLLKNQNPYKHKVIRIHILSLPCLPHGLHPWPFNGVEGHSKQIIP